MELETMTNERASIRHALLRYIFMTLVYGWITLGLIIASKNNLLHESQISAVLNIIFNGGLDFEFFAIIIASIIFTNGICSFFHPLKSRKLAFEAIGAILLTLGALGSLIPIVFVFLFNWTLWHFVNTLWIWVLFGFLGILISDVQLLENFLKTLVRNK